MATTRRVIPFAELGRQDVGRVGGKNASLGEMTAHLASTGVRVPPGSPRRPTRTESCWEDTGCAGASTSNSDGSTRRRRWKRWQPRSER